MRLLAPLLLTLLLFAAGCAGTRPAADLPTALPDAYPYHSAAQIRQLILDDVDSLRAFQARASLALRTPEQSGQFSADVRNRRNDSLYLSISPGLGIEAARALVTPDSFFLYDRIKNRLTYGSLVAAEAFLPGPLAGDDVFRNLLGLVAPEPDVAWQVEAEDDRYVLTDPAGLRTYVVDPALWRVVRYEERTPTGELVEERTFSEFDRFDGVYLPRRVAFRRPLDDTSASLYYRSLALNPGPLSFDLRVSSKAERVPAG